jgi:hypothetical protein
VDHPEKRFVYIIRSLNNPQKRYIGLTSDVGAGERAQCRAEPVDGSVETVGHRPGYRVPL